jgi:hypothetical protein
VTGEPVKFYAGNTHLLTLSGLTDAVTGTTVDDAVITATLYGPGWAPVENFVDVPLNPSGSGGNYQGQVPATAKPADGVYTLQISAAASGGSAALWNLDAVVKPREDLADCGSIVTA